MHSKLFVPWWRPDNRLVLEFRDSGGGGRVLGYSRGTRKSHATFVVAAATLFLEVKQ